MPSQCRLQADDYLECLHHTKEVSIPAVYRILTHFLFVQIARAKAVKAEFIKQAEHHAKEGRKVADVLADGVIVGVGLIKRDQGGEGKHLK